MGTSRSGNCLRRPFLPNISCLLQVGPSQRHRPQPPSAPPEPSLLQPSAAPHRSPQPRTAGATAAGPPRRDGWLQVSRMPLVSVRVKDPSAQPAPGKLPGSAKPRASHSARDLGGPCGAPRRSRAGRRAGPRRAGALGSVPALSHRPPSHPARGLGFQPLRKPSAATRSQNQGSSGCVNGLLMTDAAIPRKHPEETPGRQLSARLGKRPASRPGSPRSTPPAPSPARLPLMPLHVTGGPCRLLGEAAGLQRSPLLRAGPRRSRSAGGGAPAPPPGGASPPGAQPRASRQLLACSRSRPAARDRPAAPASGSPAVRPAARTRSCRPHPAPPPAPGPPAQPVVGAGRECAERRTRW